MRLFHLDEDALAGALLGGLDDPFELAFGDGGHAVGALVDAAGAVVGVAFAIAPDDPNVAYALTTDELAAVLATDLATQDDAGPCIR